VVTVTQTAYLRAEVPEQRSTDSRELRELGRRLDTRKGTFPFAHARLAWLESNGRKETS
jgi:hypothetical protein